MARCDRRVRRDHPVVSARSESAAAPSVGSGGRACGPARRRRAGPPRPPRPRRPGAWSSRRRRGRAGRPRSARRRRRRSARSPSSAAGLWSACRCRAAAPAGRSAGSPTSARGASRRPASARTRTRPPELDAERRRACAGTAAGARPAGRRSPGRARSGAAGGSWCPSPTVAARPGRCCARIVSMPVGEVDVRPAQRAQLAAAGAGRHRQPDQHAPVRDRATPR